MLFIGIILSNPSDRRVSDPCLPPTGGFTRVYSPLPPPWDVRAAEWGFCWDVCRHWLTNSWVTEGKLLNFLVLIGLNFLISEMGIMLSHLWVVKFVWHGWMAQSWVSALLCDLGQVPSRLWTSVSWYYVPGRVVKVGIIYVMFLAESMTSIKNSH